MNIRHITMVALPLLILLVAGPSVYSAAAWTYGISMTPTITGNYDSVEMVTQGFAWTSAPTGGTLSWWGASTTTGTVNVFVQNGYVYNGESHTICTASCTTGYTVPANSWGNFWTYINLSTGVATGNELGLATGWSYTDHLYASFAVYSSKGKSTSNSRTLPFQHQNT